MEAIETAAIRNELRPLRLEDLPDRLIGALGMGVRFRPGQTLVEEPGVEFVVALESQPRREEAFADEADLVLDLALFPSRRRSAGDGLDEVVRAHLKEAAIVLAILADEDRLNRRLHVIVYAAPAGALEESKSPLVGVEHHLLRLARIGAHEHHPAVAEAEMRDLHGRRHPVHHDNLVAPIKLVSLARRERERHIGVRRRARALFSPSDCIATNGGIAAFVPEVAQVLVYPDERQPFSGRLALVFLKQRFKPLSPGTNPRLRLPRSFVMELGRVRADDLPHDLARDPQLSADLLYRLAQREIGAAYLRNRLHNQHSNPGLPELGRPVWTRRHGVPIG